MDMQAGKLDLLNQVKNEILTLKRDAISANKLLTDSAERIMKAANQVEAYIETRLTSYGTAFTPEIRKEIKLLTKLKKAHKQITRIVENFYANHLFVEFSPSEVKHICLTRLALSSSHDQLRVGRERARVIKESNQALMSEKPLSGKADLGTRVRFSPTTVTYLVENTHYPQAKAQPK
ncbi:MAG: hypothetical protein K0U08_00360 [Proteobacteria bacterium]|nr:hypothetical protein [Pseudomonadota bacterium]